MTNTIHDLLIERLNVPLCCLSQTHNYHFLFKYIDLPLLSILNHFMSDNRLLPFQISYKCVKYGLMSSINNYLHNFCASIAFGTVKYCVLELKWMIFYNIILYCIKCIMYYDCLIYKYFTIRIETYLHIVQVILKFYLPFYHLIDFLIEVVHMKMYRNVYCCNVKF